MATYNLDEQERIDGLKSWWGTYGTTIIVTLSIFIAGIGGTQAWKYYNQQQKEQAADLYVLVQQVQQTKEAKRINDAAYLLMEGFPSSGYASRAAMIAARTNFDAGDKQAAKEKLQWVVDNAKEVELKDIARLRLSGILLDEQKYNEALRLMETKHGNAFSGLFADRKGDILAAADRIAEARQAYQLAIDRLEKSNNYYNIVQMKLDALGEASTSLK
ncbi:MAG: tetratricopeptide repeat protein [Nitrosomonas sp.]|nr:tetratricopeptide repeat protein [Nitrosomonas sp.]MDP1949838.1 tetratricopeptide repeat protein [Nitrosomonas sp.]